MGADASGSTPLGRILREGRHLGAPGLCAGKSAVASGYGGHDGLCGGIDDAEEEH